MKLDEQEFEKKLDTFRKFIADRKAEKQHKDKNENTDEDLKKEEKEEYTKKIIDKDNIKKDKKPKVRRNERKNYKNNIESDNSEEDKEEQTYLQEIKCKFQLIIQIDKVKLVLNKDNYKYNETLSDSHILILKNNENKFLFPVIDAYLVNYELEQLREWKNEEIEIEVNDKKIKAYELFKKALLREINETLEKLFKNNTYVITSLRIGKEYAKHEFLIYIEIKNRVEKYKAVKFAKNSININEEKMKPFGVRIKDMIDMAVKHSAKQAKDEDKSQEKYNNPFTPILMLYLAEVSYIEDKE